MARIAITGAGGFIGRNLVRRLLSDGHRVVAIGRSQSSLAAVASDAEQFVTDYSIDSVTEGLSGCEAVVHLAGRRSVRGEDMELMADFGYAGLNLLDGILRASLTLGIGKIVQASSIAVYSPKNRQPYSESEAAAPASNYGMAKLFCEQYAEWWSLRHGASVVSLRFAAVYGAGEKLTPALMSISDRAFNGRPITVSDGGLHTIDELYVSDAVEAVCCALESTVSGVFNVGAGRAATVREIAETANEVFANAGGLKIEPAMEGRTANLANCMSIQKAQTVLGWTPNVSLADGMTAMRDAWRSGASTGVG